METNLNKPAANDAPVIVRITAPRDVPVTIIERSDWGPWWSAIAGALGLNALIFMLAMIIMR